MNTLFTYSISDWKAFYCALFLTLLSFHLHSQCSLIISGIIDGPLGGGEPKAIELYVTDEIPDLSLFGLGFANNGDGSDGQEFTFPDVAASAGEFLYIANDPNAFEVFFGFPPDFEAQVNINGNDAVELFANSEILDVFGNIEIDGLGTAWEYTNGWAYRMNNFCPNHGIFNALDWQYSGIEALEGATINDTAPHPMPIESFEFSDCGNCQQPSNTDTDEDGISDSEDNCPTVANTDQVDEDADNFGAACDCDDLNADINPEAMEILGNGLDDNCDGEIDENSGGTGCDTIDCPLISIDLNTWMQEGDPNAGDWSVSANGQTVTQSINGDPTIFVSTTNHINTSVEGTFQVATTNDNDFIGFVFGYQSPTTTNIDEYDFLLFDWRQADDFDVLDGQALEGFSLSRIKGMFANIAEQRRVFWSKEAHPALTILADDYGTDKGWEDNTLYNFQLDYTDTNIKIFINDELIFDVDGVFPEGRFGFYNYSQNFVEYMGFTENTDCQTFYADMDDDGFGDPNNIIEDCVAPPGYVANANDCDDSNPDINPTTDEIPNNGIDDNCDGVIDENNPDDQDEDGIPDTDDNCPEVFNPDQLDEDQDGYGAVCDCDDTNPDINPAVDEIPNNGIDENCDGSDEDCDNLTDPGEICCDQTLFDCGGNLDPAIIENVTLPSGGGGTGEIEYVWIFTNTNPDTTNAITWNLYLDSDSSSFDPPIITETIWVRRCARREGCEEYIAESNIIQISVQECPTDCDDFEIALNAKTDATCFGGNNGSIDLSITGAMGNVNFDWTPDLGSVEDPNGLTAGAYAVVATDSVGCIAELVVMIDEPDSLFISGNSVDISCFDENDGSIMVAGNGGTPMYEYAWIPDLGNTQNPDGLAAGNYALTLTDVNGCTAVTDFQILNPAPLEITIIIDQPSCDGNDGSIQTQVSGGIPPYSYDWDNGIGNVQNPTGLSPGTYLLTVTDGKGCIAETTVILNHPVGCCDFLLLLADKTDVSCFGANDGSINLLPMGGVEPITYDWAPDLGNVEDPDSLAPGNYTVMATDSTGCLGFLIINIESPDSLQVIAETTDVSCDGNDGSISLEVVGGTPDPILGYNYAWTPDLGNIQNPDGLPAGDYSVVVTDANGCTDAADAVVTPPTDCEPDCDNFLVTLDTVIHASCAGAEDGSIQLTVTGSSGFVSFNWTPDLGNVEDPENLPAGTYFVVVVDSVGCVATLDIEIAGSGEIQVLAEVYNTFCPDSEDGFIDLFVLGGMPDYTYEWSNGSEEEDQANVPAGDYSVIVTDANGCTGTNTFTVSSPDPLTAEFEVIDAPCNESTGSIDLTTGGGNPPYSYNWNMLIGNVEDPDSLAAGTYKVTITDANGCVIFGEATVNTDCFNGGDFEFTQFIAVPESDGSIQLTWQTMNETPTGSFLIEHSKDGDLFSMGDTPIEAFGLSLAPNNYDSKDTHPYQGMNYYRIRYVTFEGAQYLSPIREVMLMKGQELVYPNPFSKEVTVEFAQTPNLPAQLMVINLLGQEVRIIELKEGVHQIKIDLSEQPAGIYHLWMDENGSRRRVSTVVRVVE